MATFRDISGERSFHTTSKWITPTAEHDDVRFKELLYIYINDSLAKYTGEMVVSLYRSIK